MILPRFAGFLASALLGCAAAEATTTTVPQKQAQPAPGQAVVRLGGGCEGVKAAYIEECRARPETCESKAGMPDIGADAYGAALNKGTYLNACGTPPTMAVKICAAVRDGRVQGVTVTTSPGDEAVATCIGQAIQRMTLPSSPQLDITSTVFAAP
jgi:hypothetical protein